MDSYIRYVCDTLLNPIAIEGICCNAKKTQKTLARIAGSLKLCGHPILHKPGYHAIKFDKYDFAMLYRVEDETAYVDSIYHRIQDYENLFVEEL